MLVSSRRVGLRWRARASLHVMWLSVVVLGVGLDDGVEARGGGGGGGGGALDVDPRAGITRAPFGTWRGVFDVAPTDLGARIVSGGSIPPVKVFVYTEKEVPSLKLLMPPKDSPVLRTGICGQKMYGTQVHVHRFLLNAKHVRTTNPDEADFFYVPGWPKCMLDAPPNGAGISPEELSARYVRVIRALPHFHRNGNGRDHVFLWPSGRGPTLFKDWRCHVADSIFITPEGHYTSPYRDMVRKQPLPPAAVHVELTARVGSLTVCP